MHCRLRNVALLLFVLVLVAGLAPAQSNSPSARIPALYPTATNPQLKAWNVREEFEGPNTADFFNSINNPNSPNASLMANPQIAVGPDEMLLVANSQIWRLPNGNASGNIPTGLYPGSALIGGQAFGAQRASLDNWIGSSALAVLCPTGNPDLTTGTPDPTNTRSAVTCQIDNATVTYDQMHGRFLVLFTVVDTGLTFNQATQGFTLTRPRKASWVLVVSRFAILVDQACFQQTQPSASCPTPPVPGSQPNAAGSFAFVTPTPPSGSLTGGINTAIWAIYYGNSLNALGADGFGSASSSGAGATWIGDVGVGNVNSLPGIATAAASFGCNPADQVAAGATPTTVCYFPTSARLGVDNDTVTIASAVVNSNINGANLSATYNPPAAMPGYAGTRVRVIKKSALYNFSALTAGNQYAATLSTAAGSSYYDLYTSPNNDGLPVANAGGPPIVFTAVINATACTAGSQPNLTTEATHCMFTPLFYEPAHLRGRAQATFSNLPVGSPTQNSQTYLVGAVSSPNAQSSLYVQGIQEVITGAPSANQFGTFPFFPVLMNGVTPVGAAAPLQQQGFPSQAPINSFFFNPGTVSQCNYWSSSLPCQSPTPAPNLFVGDSRPHTVIFREGHLYDARVISTSPVQATFPGSTLSTTAKYEIIQKLCSNNTNNTCPVSQPGGPIAVVTHNGTSTSGSVTITASTTGDISVGEPVVSVNLPANTIVVTIVSATSFTVSQAAVASGTVPFNFGNGISALPNLVYQQVWQNTNAYAPMFDVPANVLTFGVGTPYNALNYLEKLFVATTVPPLSGLPDTSYAVAPAGTPTALLGDFVAAAPDPRTRITYGATGLTPTALPGTANCYSNQLSPGAPVSGSPNNPIGYAGLFDTRCGTDVTDSNPLLRDPYTGLTTSTYAYTFRGGEGIDPNDGSLWNFGAYAQKRDASLSALAHWGTFAANYKLSFPTTDPYGNSTVLFNDIANTAEQPYIQMAINLGFVPSLNNNGIPLAPPNSTPIPFAGVNGTLYGNGAGAVPIPFGMNPPGNAPAAGNFGPDDAVTRREMAYWIVKSVMDENAITLYLANGPSLNGVTGSGVTFADVPASDPGWRYVEIMARRGWTSGCAAGVARRFCPDYVANRRDLAAFMIRAKMSNVFPSVLSGCTFGFVNGTTSPTSTIFPPALTTNCAGGDNFGLFVPGLTYFTDNPQAVGNDWYVFIQKMREMRITNGTSLGPLLDGRNGTYSPGDAAPVVDPASPGALLRKQVAVFMVRGFFF